MRRHRLDAVFLTQVYSGSKFCLSVLEAVGLRVPPRRIRDFALFSVCYSCKNCPSARRASAANVVCRDDYVFGSRNILQDSWLYIIVLFLLSYYYYYYYYYYTFIFLIFILTHYYYIIIIIIIIIIVLYCILFYYCTYTVLLYLHCAMSIIGLVAADSAHR
jgi:hypothetical protein